MKFQRCAEQLQTVEDELSDALKVKEFKEKELTDLNSAHWDVMKNLQVNIIRQFSYGPHRNMSY